VESEITLCCCDYLVHSIDELAKEKEINLIQGSDADKGRNLLRRNRRFEFDNQNQQSTTTYHIQLCIIHIFIYYVT
jgi:hypothetical protein